MYLTRYGSVYIENAWYWVADHDLGDPTWADNNNKMTQTSVYVSRGFLVESTKPSWLYRTSLEHSVYYQYQFSGAANVLAGMIQSGQPYYQPTPAAPAPFESSLGVFRGDPSFQCTEEQPCDQARVCRELITAKDNQAVDFHPFWSQLSRFEAREFAKPISSEPMLEHGDGKDPSEALTAQLSEVCSRLDTCMGIMIPVLMCGGSGYTLVGYDTEGCISGFARPICCKSAAAPTECQWRANVGGVQTGCVNRCEAGEVPLLRSNSGGGLKSDYGGLCVRGWREFCCKHPGFKSVTQGCEWVKQATCLPNRVCPSGKTSVATRITSANGPLGCLPTEDYCCPSNHVQLSNCHWVGQGDCMDSVCNSGEITADTSFFGDVSLPCNWERKKSLCCTPEFKVPERTCARRVCEANPAACPADLYGLGPDEFDENYAETDLFDGVIEQRTVVPRREGAIAIIDPRKPNPNDPGPPASTHQRDYTVLSRTLQMIFLYARNYYQPTGAYQNRNRNGRPRRNVNLFGFRPGGMSRGCSSIETFDIQAELFNLQGNYSGYNLDHRIELQYLRDFVRAVLWGELVDGTDIRSIAAPIPEQDFDHYWNWNNQHLPIGMRPVSLTSPRNRVAANPHRGMLSVNNRLFESLGASTNMAPLMLIDANLNRIKGNMFHIETETRALQPSTGRPGLNGLTAIFDLFDDNWWEEAADHVRLWIGRHLEAARLAVIGGDHAEALYILLELDNIWTETLRHVRGPGRI
ncbi:hypothetical protein Micbo1qcDRAFT_173664 [Microdochium bolleyi]|uniref:Uncharacterized protein n=1 Tax=Microdochium bolleyi TaxID=196109 RepID=A0A136JCQ7_9PEZI|nr:hypothetical protein Micbo1qcDRAFT_173664 [Microdochium bolleyi]